jgi:hypothetical protein
VALQEEAAPITAAEESPWPIWLRGVFVFCVAFLAITSRSALCYFWPFVVGDPVCNSLDWGWDEATAWIFGTKPEFGTVREWSAKIVTAVLLAAAVTALWLSADRRSQDYRRAHIRVRTSVRYLLAAVMLYYGAIKLIDAQFPRPTVGDLITPLGEFSRSQLLWNFMGVSRAYSLFGGLLEFVGGLLLFWRRTTALAVVVLLGALTNVAALNFAYDVPVKAHTTVYLVMAVLLFAPHAGRLADVLLLNRPVAPIRAHDAATDWGWNPNVRAILKATVVLWIVGANLYVARRGYVTFGNGAPRPPLYGVYEVGNFKRNGIEGQSGEIDSDWTRIAIGERGTAVIQPVHGSTRFFSPDVDTVAGTLRLTAWDSTTAPVVLRYRRLTGNHIQLEGTSGRDTVRMELRPVNLDSIPLLAPVR